MIAWVGLPSVLNGPTRKDDAVNTSTASRLTFKEKNC